MKNPHIDFPYELTYFLSVFSELQFDSILNSNQSFATLCQISANMLIPVAYFIVDYFDNVSFFYKYYDIYI
jgi:hypothetical protein